jgi:c(7)-type cytochrome triheme protein
MNRSGRWILILCLTTLAAGAEAFQLKDIRYQTENAGTVIFSHDSHLKKKPIRNNCKACHRADTKRIPRATMAEMETGKSCGTCHNGTKAFALKHCLGCHKVKEVKLTAGDLGAIAFSHRGHAGALHCNRCHNQLFRTAKNAPVGMAAMKEGRSCGGCHDAQHAFGLGKCLSCHLAKDPAYIIPAAGKVSFSHRFHLDVSTCRDCHQKIFPLGGKRKPATMADMAAGKSCGACHDGKSAFTAQENCARCHLVP